MFGTETLNQITHKIYSFSCLLHLAIEYPSRSNNNQFGYTGYKILPFLSQQIGFVVIDHKLADRAL